MSTYSIGYKQDPESQCITQNVQDTNQIIQHMKIHENLNVPGKRQSTCANDEMKKMLELSNKDLKVSLTKMFK